MSLRVEQVAREILRGFRGIGGWGLAFAAGALLMLLRATWRVRLHAEVSPLDAPSSREIVAFWHGDQLALLALPRSVIRSASALVSRSRDGDLGTRIARLIGIDVVRGSSSRGGVMGALGLVRRLHRERRVALAVDGPRGPRHRARPTALRLARMAAAPVVVVAALPRRCWTISCWDRLAIPAPFTTIVVLWQRHSGADLQRGMDDLRWHARSFAGSTSPR